MHPFLDTSSLSDDEIIDRLSKAYSYLHAQTTLGHTPTVISIKEVIQSLENERANRMGKMATEEASRKNPNSLKSIDLGKID